MSKKGPANPTASENEYGDFIPGTGRLVRDPHGYQTQGPQRPPRELDASTLSKPLCLQKHQND